MHVGGCQGLGERRRYRAKVQAFSYKVSNFWDLVYGKMTVTNNTVLYPCKLLRRVLNVLTTKW